VLREDDAPGDRLSKGDGSIKTENIRHNMHNFCDVDAVVTAKGFPGSFCLTVKASAMLCLSDLFRASRSLSVVVGCGCRANGCGGRCNCRCCPDGEGA